MFERFTARARQVVVLAEEEARTLKHGHVGAEHILLGLLREGQGLAAHVLQSRGITVDRVRAQLERLVGPCEKVTPGPIPFTPQARGVLALALREALSLGDDSIGTEHILLALARKNDGTIAGILLDLDADFETIRRDVLRNLEGPLRRPWLGVHRRIDYEIGGERPTPSPEMENDSLRSLWMRYKASGDERARERLVVAYAPLVKYVAGRLSSGLPAHVEEADLISYGLTGLISAIERFDPAREIKFETYAITRIRGAIIDELRTVDWVPRSVRARAREIERANMKLEARLKRAPTDEEIARELGISVREFRDALMQISRSTIVALGDLWSGLNSGGDQVSLLDTLPDRGPPGPGERDRIADAIAALPEREKLVIALYYYENLTLREIGEVLGMTRSRVSQLHSKALLRLQCELARDVRRARSRFRRALLRLRSKLGRKDD